MSPKTSLLALLFGAILLGQENAPPSRENRRPTQSRRPRSRRRTDQLVERRRVRSAGRFRHIMAANVNAPMLAGDGIQTGPASRAEVQFDFGNRVRLSALADVRLGDLREGAIQVQVGHGTVTYTVIADSKAQVEISTPNASLRPMGRGAYRISVLDDGTTQFDGSSRAGRHLYAPRLAADQRGSDDDAARESQRSGISNRLGSEPG